jgi:SAM-dependent methyltransferase
MSKRAIKFTRQQMNDLKKIMSAEEEMIPLLSLFKPKNRILNPWEKQFPNIFKKLRIKKGMKVIDIPCGQGGVSVPLAKTYGVNVTGYDIMPAYVQYAREYAKQKQVTHLCQYNVADIREVIRQKNEYDILLWIGPPHVWGSAKSTISKLRNIVSDTGMIVIADAYLYYGVGRKGMYKDYENLKNTNKGYTSLGDDIIEIYDYKSTLWNFDYSRTRKEVISAIKRAKADKDKNIVKRYLASLEAFQNKETKELGLAIWILRINKHK